MSGKPMIPSMGGRELGPVFNRYIEIMPYGLDVVEIGAWLGAGTYELASAMRDHGHVGGGKNQSTLHVYDRFTASASEVNKAAAKCRYEGSDKVDLKGKAIKIKAGENTLPVVKRLLAPFPFVKFYRGDVGKMKYDGHMIGVLVIDAAKRAKDFLPLMKKIEPHLAPGATVFFMDFYFHLKNKDAGTECQGAYVKASGRYTLLENVSGLSCAVFRYEGKA